ncbi:hypothetical protein BSL78_17191 [Apostichopus japonicus]|uniref:Uncharacterized protein n=1 Tax=Stichopus japonicus TaxID=307972 RepID=A0A2G8KD90_STIJA|nr:hypothetical protein BSL78_17191 [Apostichopus japonicus]
MFTILYECLTLHHSDVSIAATSKQRRNKCITVTCHPILSLPFLKDNIDVTSQNKEILQKCTAVLSLLESLTDSGLSSGPNSSMASDDLRELEASNAQDIEADVC